MRRGVIIELDGVLVDSAPRRSAALAVAFAAAGVRPPAATTAGDPIVRDVSADFDELVSEHIAANPRDAALAALDDTARALIALDAEREDRAGIAAGVTLVAGARDAVAALASEYRVAVVTAWRRVDADRVLTLAGLADVVRFVVAADDGPGFASSRARYARAVSRLRRAGAAGPLTALVAGPRGSAAARAAGAHATLIGTDVLIAGLTPARLAAVVPASPPLFRP